MKIQLGKFPLEIADDKIPDLLERMIPMASKHMGTLKEMGVDVTPAIRKFFGATDTPTPAAPTAAPTLEELQKQGWWKHSDGRLYPPDLAPRPSVPVNNIPVPVVHGCGNCIRGNAQTGQPLTSFNPPCTVCQFDSNKSAFSPR